MSQTEDELRQWINDLQTGMYINCVYCGHRYGPREAEIPQATLRRHVAQCPEHPLSMMVRACKAAMDQIARGEDKEAFDTLREAVRDVAR